MAGQATPPGPSWAARNSSVHVAGDDPDDASGRADPCLVCGRPAAWRIERPLGGYLVCEWCASIIRDYDARHPEHDPSRHVRLTTPDD